MGPPSHAAWSLVALLACLNALVSASVMEIDLVFPRNNEIYEPRLICPSFSPSRILGSPNTPTQGLRSLSGICPAQSKTTGLAKLTVKT